MRKRKIVTLIRNSAGFVKFLRSDRELYNENVQNYTFFGSSIRVPKLPELFCIVILNFKEIWKPSWLLFEVFLISEQSKQCFSLAVFLPEAALKRCYAANLQERTNAGEHRYRCWTSGWVFSSILAACFSNVFF